MPAQGRGAFLTPRAPAKPQPHAAPPPPPPHRAPVPVHLAGALPQQPFAAAQHQAARAVAHAQASHRPVPHAYIPNVPHPTHAQSQAALQIARRTERQSGIPARDYQRELRTDPRLAPYRKLIEHYARAGEGQQAALEGRRVATGAPTVSQIPHRALAPLSRDVTAGLVGLGRREWAANAGQRSTAGPGKAPSSLTLPIAGIRLPTGKIAAAVSDEAAKLAPGLAGATPETQFAKAFLGDAKQLGTLPLLGTIAFGKAGVAAAEGNLTPAKQLAQGIGQGFEKGAAGQLLQGNLQGVGEAVRQHPLFSLTEALGVSGVAGRTAGAAARAFGTDVEAGGLGGALARAGSTVRSPIALTDQEELATIGNALHERGASPDLIRKAFQHLADLTREPIRDKQGNVVTVEQRGRQVPVLKARSDKERLRLQRGRVSHERSSAQAVERGQREVARKEGVRAGAESSRRPGPIESKPNKITGKLRPIKLPKKLTPTSVRAIARDVVPLVAEGAISTAANFAHDVQKRIDEIKHELEHGTYLGKDEQVQAENNLRLLEAALHPQVLKRAGKIVKEGEAWARDHLNPADRELVRNHIYPRAQVERSQLTTWAVAQMGARHVTEKEHEALEDAVAKRGGSREEQLAVSGMHPDRAREHEEAKARLKAAREQHNAALKDVERANHDRGRAVGEARRAPRNRPFSRLTGAERRAREHGTTITQVADSRLKGAKERLAAARKQVKVEEHNLRLSPMPKRQAGIRHGDGRYLSNEEIWAHAQKAGRDPSTLAYLPHRLNPEDARSYHRQLRLGQRPSNSGDELRTYAMFKRGGNTISHHLLRDELTAKRTVAAQAASVDKGVRDFGLRHPEYKALQEALANDPNIKLSRAERRLIRAQGYMTEPEAKEIGKTLEREGHGQFEAVRAFSSKAPGADWLREELKGATMDVSHLGLLDRKRVSINPTDEGVRNVVLIPKAVIDEQVKHLTGAGGLERRAQLVNLPFRMAVLPQPRWLTGNFLEPFVIRLPLAGSGLVNLPGLAMDIHAANKVLKRLDGGTRAEKQTAEAIRHYFFQGLFVGRKGASPRRTYEDFAEGTWTRAALHLGHVIFKEMPVFKQFADLALLPFHAFFHVNRIIESTAQRAAFGSQVRDELIAWGYKWHQTMLLGDKAVNEVAEGLVNTSTQHRFMREQHELLGQYDGFKPALKHSIQSVTPFLPWTLASLRFVYWTLPAHHTVAFNLLLKAGQSVQNEWEAQHADVPPGSLRGAIPAADGGLRDVGRYTPYGITQPLGELGDKGVPANSALEGITGTLLPQISGALEALSGRDAFGRELQVSGGDHKPSGPQEVEIALNSLIEGLIPGVAIARRLQEGGGTGYADSTVLSPKTKPGTSHSSAIDRTLNPFRETYLKSPIGGGAESPREKRIDRRLERTENSPRAQQRERRLERRSERMEKRLEEREKR